MTTIEQIADWAAGLSPAHVPGHVQQRCREQRAAVLGGVAASAHDPAAKRLLDAVAGWAGEGPAPLIGTGRCVAVEDAVYAGAALSVALDFDDYLCFGHTGHSAVLVPVLLAAETGSGGDAQLLAQVVANEVAARLGGASLLGPMNGQLWAFIHAAGAAVAAGRLLGLGAGGLSHALAIALAQPPRATVPGFVAPDSKLLTTAAPAAAGVRAARLAAAGVTGPLDALDAPRGALGALSYAPLRAALARLGDGWATTTLTVKLYPGCAYVDTTVDALLELTGGEPLDADAVVAVHVAASLLTCGMDDLSAPHAAQSPPTPVTVTFSIPWTVAIVLLAGRLTEHELHPGWLREHAPDLDRIRRVVRLRHDPELTATAARAFAPVLPPAAVVRELGAARLLAALRRVRAEHPATGLGLGGLAGVARALISSGGARAALRRRHWWEQAALDDFAMTAPARVTLHLGDGTRRTARVDHPRGGAGHPTHPPGRAARDRLAASGPRLWDERGAVAIADAVAADAGTLHDLLGG